MTSLKFRSHEHVFEGVSSFKGYEWWLFEKFAVEMAGFVSSAIFLIKHVLGLVLPGGTLSRRARYLLDFFCFRAEFLSVNLMSDRTVSIRRFG